jgi:lipoprotein-anchoring transpeptidase ErfK/SrfK
MAHLDLSRGCRSMNAAPQRFLRSEMRLCLLPAIVAAAAAAPIVAIAAPNNFPDSANAAVARYRTGGGFFEQLFGGGSGNGPIPRQRVSFDTRYKPGTIVIKTQERRLYLVTGQGEALRYGVGVGRAGFTWRGTHRVTAKREWPDWTPPPQMLRREPRLPRFMPGGEDNPLGARALYLGSTLYRIHGSNEADTIGTAISSGCFRLTNEDVIDLYDRVKVGATVIVQ